jgi:UDP-N-acetylmuramoyl-L-alanine---L-glutamate ligase
MKITELNGKTVCVLGYGREGKAMVEALEKHAPQCEITIADKDATIEPENGRHWLQVGEGWLKNLEKFDVIIKSPGIPPHVIEAAGYPLTANRLPITSSTQIFFETIADRNEITIGITGSKGKSTTSTLLYSILKAAGKDAVLTGNIGEPSIAHLDDVKEGTIVVMEMSSYQLMDLTVSPHIAVVTSFFPEHLDYHGSIEAYLEAKKHIARFQSPDDTVFFNAASPGTADIAKEGDGSKVPFTPEDCPVPITETRLIGEHNCGNIAVACMVAASLGVDGKTALDVVRHYQGLPHRLQSLGVHHGMEWIDDAISTTPESAIAALDALGDRVTTIILGGQDRGYDFTPLAERIKHSSIRLILLFPGSGPRIREALTGVSVSAEIIDVGSMQEAVEHALTSKPANQLISTPVVLLSTASPSYGMFRNFEEKGEVFRQCVEMA